MKCLTIAITSLICLICLTACESTVFGVPQSQWNALTPQQQSDVIAGYNQRQQTATQNAPIMAAIGAASTILSSKTASNSQGISNNSLGSFDDVPLQGGCINQGNTTNCHYSGSKSTHSSSSNFSFPKF